MLAIFSEMSVPDDTRAGRWVGCRSLEQALDILAKSGPGEPFDDDWGEVGNPDDGMPCFSDPYGVGLEKSSLLTASEPGAMGADVSDEDAGAIHVESSASEGRSEDDHEEDEDLMQVAGQAVSGLVSGAGTSDSRVFKHRVSGIYHIMSRREEVPDVDGEMSSTKCGKLITQNFQEIDQFESSLPTKCKRCFAT